MSAALVAELRAEAEKMWEQSLATKATHNRAELRRRGKLIKAAAAALEAADRDHRQHVEEDGYVYSGCDTCTAILAEEQKP